MSSNIYIMVISYDITQNDIKSFFFTCQVSYGMQWQINFIRHHITVKCIDFVMVMITVKPRTISKYSLRGYIFQKLLLAWSYSCIKMCFYQGDGYLWPHCFTNNLYIPHRLLYAPTYSFWAIGSLLISPFRVTSWFDTIYNVVALWINFRENNLHCICILLSDICSSCSCIFF